MAENMFQDKNIQQFWEEIAIGLPASFASAAQLILIRLDRRGHCPSVRTPERTPLEAITLTEHTLRVVRNVHGMGVPGTPLYNCAIISALGHDIAKIPGVLPRNHFAKILHARKGAEYLQSRLHGVLEERSIDLIYETVFHHHDYEKVTSSTKQLKEADHEARRTESMLLGIQILEYGVDPKAGTFVPVREFEASKERYTVTSSKIPPDPDAERVPWFSVQEFLAALEPKVNNLDFYTWGPEAISMSNDICYFTPNVIYDTFKDLAIAKKWSPIELIDNTAVNPQRRRNLLALIGKRMKEEKVLAIHVLPPLPNYYMGQYEVSFTGLPTRSIWYMPIIGRFIADYILLERRKTGSLFRGVRTIHRMSGKWGAIE